MSHPTRAAVTFVTLLVSAVALRAQTLTPLGACPANASGARPSRGALEVLTSDVPELALESMSWSVSTHRVLFGYDTDLEMGGRITATRETPLAGIGVLFESRRDTSIVRQLETGFSEDRAYPVFEQASTLIHFHRVTPARPVPVHYYNENSGREPADRWGCPARVRIVRMMNLATHVGLMSRVERDSAALLSKRRATGEPLRPFEVLIDTTVSIAPGTVIGVAVNTTSRTLHDAAVWVIATYANLDTLVFPIGDVAPHALVTFGGGDVSNPSSSRGGWTDADPGPRVTAEYGNRIGDFRRAKNGTIHRSLRADDEQPWSDHFQWDPANFDLDTALAFGRGGVYALLRGPTSSTARVDFAVIGTKILYHTMIGGQLLADSARLTMPQMDALSRASDKARSIPMIPRFPNLPLTSEDSAALKVQPGINEEVIAINHGPGPFNQRVRFPAGNPPLALQPLYGVLRQLEEQARVRAEQGRGRD